MTNSLTEAPQTGVTHYTQLANEPLQSCDEVRLNGWRLYTGVNLAAAETSETCYKDKM